MDSANNVNGAAEEKRVPNEAECKAHLEQVMNEKNNIDGSNFPIAQRLLDGELNKSTEKYKNNVEFRYTDLYHDKTVKLTARVLFPAKKFPNFNFVGKLLGPGGNTLRQLQEQTKCRLLILGRGSMRDKAKEEVLRTSGDPKYLHLNDELHVEVSCLAPPTEAYSRMAYAMRELRAHLQPDASGEYGYGEEVTHPISGRGPGTIAGATNSQAKVMNILSKARRAMDAHPQTPPARRYPAARAYGEAAMFEGDGQWVSGYKAPVPAGRFFPPRNAPYPRQ